MNQFMKTESFDPSSLLQKHFLSKFRKGQNSFGILLMLLVGGIPTPLKNMSSSVGMMKFPTEWKVIKFHGSKPPTRIISNLHDCWLNSLHVPNHQPALQWFQTFLFSMMYGIILPIDFHIFKMVITTNQITTSINSNNNTITIYVYITIISVGFYTMEIIMVPVSEN